MFRIACSFLIVLTVAVAHGEKEDRELDAVEIFDCNFSQDEWDLNYDDWPDKWTREVSKRYPHYVEMKIKEDPELSDGRCLSIYLDGGNAKISTPPIRVLPRFSYTLNLRLKSTGIKHSRVTIVLEFVTPSGEVVQTHRSDPVRQTEGWIDLTIGKYRPLNQDVDRVIAHVEVDRGERGDLTGVVSVADVWLARWPSMEVTTNSLFNVYHDLSNIVVTCSLSGISEQRPLIRFQLLDATQTELNEKGEERLQGRLIKEETMNASEYLMGTGKHSKGFEGETTWEPSITEHGFYRVRVRMDSEKTNNTMDERVITLAVVPRPEADKSSSGEFGWSLPESVPRIGQPLDFATLQELLPLAGLSWVKLPVWFPREEMDRGDRIIQFAERLAATDIETIGIIQPPDQAAKDSITEESLNIEYVFRPDPSHWLPLYDHVMNRLSLRLRWWQLGYDNDTSFVGHEDLVSKITDFRKNMYRFGQDIRLGLGWRWDATPIDDELSWEFEQFSADPPLQSDQLDQALMSQTRETAPPQWVLVEPVLSEEQLANLSTPERHEVRVREFIKQILVAKKHGADGIFVAHPFSGPDGVMNTDGTPGELLLPWRTAATLLGGAEYIGTLHLPNKSTNWLFRRPDKDPNKQVVMVVWNDVQTQEVLYLGDSVKRIDVWGKSSDPPTKEHRQVINVGPEPTFVLGVNESVARWRMGLVFEKQAIPSVFGVEHQNSLSFTNAFPFGVGGAVDCFVPDMIQGGDHSPDNPSKEWTVFTPQTDFKSAAGKPIQYPLEILLDHASFGEQPIRIDFDLNEHTYKFSVWRSLSVGIGDIHIQVSTRLHDNGRLIIQQRMVNADGPHADFKCLLDGGGRRRKKTQVFQLSSEPDIKSYYYPNGKEVIGQDFKLEIQEIDGERVLIHRFVAEEMSEVQFESDESTSRRGQ